MLLNTKTCTQYNTDDQRCSYNAATLLLKEMALQMLPQQRNIVAKSEWKCGESQKACDKFRIRKPKCSCRYLYSCTASCTQWHGGLHVWGCNGVIFITQLYKLTVVEERHSIPVPSQLNTIFVLGFPVAHSSISCQRPMYQLVTHLESQVTNKNLIP